MASLSFGGYLRSRILVAASECMFVIEIEAEDEKLQKKQMLTKAPS